MSSFDIVLIKTNDFDNNTLVKQREQNFTKDINSLMLKANYLNMGECRKMLEDICEVKTVTDNDEFMAETIEFLGNTENMININDCYEYRNESKMEEYTYQVMYKMPNSEDNIDKLKHNLLGSLLTLKKELLYGNIVLFKTKISTDSSKDDETTSCTLDDVLGLLMNCEYHTGVYVDTRNNFREFYFNNNFEIVDPFNQWGKINDIPDLLRNKEYGVIDKTYFKFPIRVCYNSSSEEKMNEPLTRLSQGFVKGDGMIISPFNDNSFYDVTKKDVLDLIKNWEKLKHEDVVLDDDNKEMTKYQAIYCNNK